NYSYLIKSFAVSRMVRNKSLFVIMYRPLLSGLLFFSFLFSFVFSTAAPTFTLYLFTSLPLFQPFTIDHLLFTNPSIPPLFIFFGSASFTAFFMLAAFFLMNGGFGFFIQGIWVIILNCYFFPEHGFNEF